MLRRLAFDRFVGALFLAATGAAACLMPAQSDTWWHLRSGEATWRAGAVQLHDAFSYTMNGSYWPNQEWLSELLFYGLYRGGGLPLLTGIAALTVVLTWAIVWRLTPGSVRWRALLCTGAAAASAPEWSLRPKLFTLLLAAITVFLLSRRRYLWLPPLFLLWANLHGGVVLGLLLLCAALLAEMAATRRIPLKASAAACGCFAAVSLTPLGLSFWTEIPRSIARIKQYGIDEWAPPRLADPVMAPFWAIAGALVAGALWRRRGALRDARERVLFWCALALLPFAVTAERNVSVALLVATPVVGYMAAASRFGGERPADGRRDWLHVPILAGVVAAALVLVAGAWRAPLARLEWHPVGGGVVRALASCQGNLYNRYDDGGYVIWFVPARKVFIDGRQDPYPSEMMLEHMRVERSGDYRATFKRYSIGCAFLPPDSPVARSLMADGWATAYADARSIVLSQLAPSPSPPPPSSPAAFPPSVAALEPR